jgi:thiol-disulfide isomerase/thioredoxin
MSDNQNQISRRTSAVVIGTAVLIGLVVLAVNFDPSSDASTEVFPPLDASLTGAIPGLQLPEAGYLAVGDQAPPLQAAHWATDTPESVQSYEGRLTIIDLWGAWCPFARQLSPGLIQMRDEFRDEPLEFVSLTVGAAPPDGQPERGWLSGYDPGESLTAFRCLFMDITYGLAVHPTIYLVGPDGNILWCDEGMREQHAETDEVERAVRSAVTKALAMMNSAATSDIPPQSSGESVEPDSN